MGRSSRNRKEVSVSDVGGVVGARDAAGAAAEVQERSAGGARNDA